MQHPNFGPDVLKKLGTAGSAFTIVLFLVVFQYTFKLDFVCPCDPYYNDLFCAIYIIMPTLTLMCILILIDSKIKMSCICGSKLHNSKCFCSCMLCLFKIIILTLLWIVTAFIDGDWYVCIKTTERNNTSWQEQIVCKDKKNQTTEETKIIRWYFIQSRIYGLSGLLFICVLWTLCVLSCGTRPYYKSRFEKLKKEEVKNLLETKLKEQAAEMIKGPCEEKINQIQEKIHEINEAISENQRATLTEEQTKNWTEISDPMFFQKITTPRECINH